MDNKSVEQALDRILARLLLARPSAMSEEKDPAAGGRHAPSEAEKSPSSLPGPNRFPDTDRYGEALAPGTIPDEERKKRDGEKTPEGTERP